MRKNVPRQVYINLGYFEVFQKVVHTSNGNFNKPVTKITNKGIGFLDRYVKNHGISDDVRVKSGK